MPQYTGSIASTFPQTSKNRTLDQWKEELAEFSGGQSRTDILSRAQSSIFEAINTFNQVYWKFNRVSQDITLASPVAGTVGEYNLSGTFARPLRAVLVDSNDKTRDNVTFVPWSDWVSVFPHQSTTGASPIFYTVRNEHEVGRVTVDPPPATSLTYPTLRLFYFRWIDCPSNGQDIVECPKVVEQSIFDESVFRFIRKVRGYGEAREARADALVSRAAVEREWRDFEDYYGS